ncbi:16S rRNA processing protein RimM [Sphingomonas sp. HDW15A]|uniref:ribosome maturation factor RimM n=1 Tax=Sphingomonas sp. HDW15A TaxID=2714942 RepID=UPI001409552F|nr:ribosome maturation factor RimM [Sphingomonas sp. HDW15A]QIK95954.1 16S rRNA processing protein RimM [Sphingomonas sp. HDW15A]
MDGPETGKRVTLAAVAGAHGVKGEVRLKLFTDSIDGLACHDKVYLDGRLVALKSVKDSGKTAIARFDGVSDRSAAEALRGSLVEIDRSALPPLEEGEYYHADLIGLTCFSESDDTIGSVVGVENFGAGDLLDIELVSGKRALIPFRDPISRMEGARIVLDPEFLA